MAHERRSSTNRREFVTAVTTGGIAATLAGLKPGLAQIGREQQPRVQWERVRLGPGGAILDVPENKTLLAQIARAPELTPEQLLAVAARYRDNPSTATLAYRLAVSAMATITSNQAVDAAVKRIAQVEVPWSIFGDIWRAITDFFTGGTGDRDPTRCRYKCFGVVLVEKCGDRDAWHIVGICIGFSW
jgi:hypothetical protein